MLKPVTLINTLNQLKVWPEFIKAVKTQFNIPLKRELRKNTLQMHGDEREEYRSLIKVFFISSGNALRILNSGKNHRPNFNSFCTKKAGKLFDKLFHCFIAGHLTASLCNGSLLSLDDITMAVSQLHRVAVFPRWLWDVIRMVIRARNPHHRTPKRIPRAVTTPRNVLSRTCSCSGLGHGYLGNVPSRTCVLRTWSRISRNVLSRTYAPRTRSWISRNVWIGPEAARTFSGHGHLVWRGLPATNVAVYERKVRRVLVPWSWCRT